jgi:hypothetical protein
MIRGDFFSQGAKFSGNLFRQTRLVPHIGEKGCEGLALGGALRQDVRHFMGAQMRCRTDAVFIPTRLLPRGGRTPGCVKRAARRQTSARQNVPEIGRMIMPASQKGAPALSPVAIL